MDNEKCIKDLATFEQMITLDNILYNFEKIFAELSMKDQYDYIHSRQFLKTIYDLGYSDGLKSTQFCQNKDF